MPTRVDIPVATDFPPASRVGASSVASTESAHPADPGRDAFATAYVIVVNALTATLSREVALACGEPVNRMGTQRRIEVCAAVWAVIQAALRATMLPGAQRKVFLESVHAQLHNHWQAGSCGAEGISSRIVERARAYLQHIDETDTVSTAGEIVEMLLDATGVPLERRATLTRLLAHLVSHRIVSDVWLFNDWESRGRLDEATSSELSPLTVKG